MALEEAENAQKQGKRDRKKKQPKRKSVKPVVLTQVSVEPVPTKVVSQVPSASVSSVVELPEYSDEGFTYIPAREERRKQVLVSSDNETAIITHKYGAIECTITLPNVLESEKTAAEIYLAPNVQWDGGKIFLNRPYTGPEEWKRKDLYHRFSTLVDHHLHWGWREYVQGKDGKINVMFSLFGTFAYVWDNKKIVEKGFFQYTFDTKGVCYHRFFKPVDRTIDGLRDFIPPRRSYISQQLINKTLRKARRAVKKA